MATAPELIYIQIFDMKSKKKRSIKGLSKKITNYMKKFEGLRNLMNEVAEKKRESDMNKKLHEIQSQQYYLVLYSKNGDNLESRVVQKKLNDITAEEFASYIEIMKNKDEYFKTTNSKGAKKKRGRRGASSTSKTSSSGASSTYGASSSGPSSTSGARRLSGRSKYFIPLIYAVYNSFSSESKGNRSRFLPSDEEGQAFINTTKQVIGDDIWKNTVENIRKNLSKEGGYPELDFDGPNHLRQEFQEYIIYGPDNKWQNDEVIQTFLDRVRELD